MTKKVLLTAGICIPYQSKTVVHINADCQLCFSREEIWKLWKAAPTKLLDLEVVIKSKPLGTWVCFFKYSTGSRIWWMYVVWNTEILEFLIKLIKG